MLPHHRSTLERAVAYFREDPVVRAVVLGGSLAKEVEKPTSDGDLMVVVSAEEFARRRRERAYAAVYHDLADYDGGYVDAKFVDEAFIRAAAERGSEPTRDSFRGARAVWSTIEGLDAELARVPVYPEAERNEKIRRFYSAALIQQFFLKEAEGRGDPFLLSYAASQMALFSGRLLLAHGRVLFPSNKRLMERVSSLTNRPEGIMEAMATLVNAPSLEAGKAVVGLLNGFHDWGIDWAAALGQYTEDSEFNWLDGPPPLAES